MTPQLPNRIFIKLLLGFWLCSSLIIATIGLLPFLQKQHDTRPIPAKLERILSNAAERFVQHPELLESPNLNRWLRQRKHRGRTIKFYVVNAHGRAINTHNTPKNLQRFLFIADESDEMISQQFKSELYFGPLTLKNTTQPMLLVGRLPEHHPRPWFLFFLEHKVMTLALAIGLSGLLCGLLAWHLGRPLNSLRRSADALANGQLDSRIDQQTLNRNDELGQLGHSFNHMAEAIEATVQGQKRLMGDISHELRTPLTRLQLALAILRKKGQESPETQRIEYEAEQLNLLIGELLELSRVQQQSYNSQDKKTDCSLAETLSQVLDDAEFEAAQQNKELRIDIDDALAAPHYPRLLARAVENLLRNAIYYANHQITIQVEKQGEQIQLIIADDGEGVALQELESIFKPFYRPQQARERQTGGWGLGLAITHAAIAAHQGNIQASNCSPSGLKITINIPC
ncbi:ATP-binding protein [Shewanella gelidii]|uniref:histidine kinase n=1 Tax=Shewanella gelidii TaxID=1642821 RepID=A0A917JSZ3_9GAMM|nr:ATP-binding protein [Shewanella gelidii]MCL1098475.1 ATP-binding protein [Shewanella gelidii]GGI82482.1 two-component sensor histidine kinase [Shewanella gelidii]